MSKIITRFAPSPTGALHIGSARTALFNLLYAQHNNGTYLVRIEDTDKKRSTEQAKQTIIDSLTWLNLLGNQNIIYQSHNLQRHKQIAEELLQNNKAYYCTCTPEELQQRREQAKAEGKHFTGYDRRCRDRQRDPNKPAAIRIKAPLTPLTDDNSAAAESHITDLVQGETHIPQNILDDFVILRQDGTPTYMLSVVVDDHDMNVSHIIRGDDHLPNAHRQKIIFDACGWTCPQFAHIPLIHGEDGKKLSKRHGALSTAEYKDMGYLADAVNNHILRLGFGYENQEIFSRAEAVKLFDISAVNKGAAQFDFAKLNFFNRHYIEQMPEGELIKAVNEFLPQELQSDARAQNILKNTLPFLKAGKDTLKELAELAIPYMKPFNSEETEFIDGAAKILPAIKDELAKLQDWQSEAFKPLFKDFEQRHSLKTKDLMQSLRGALLGKTTHPGAVGDILSALGKEEALQRIENTIKYLSKKGA